MSLNPSLPVLVPQPAHSVLSSGRLQLSNPLTVSSPASLSSESRALSAFLSSIGFFVTDSSIHDGIEISLHEEPFAVETFGDEGYRLTISTKGISLNAATSSGIFYGIQTLRQLLLPLKGETERFLPCLTIEDQPLYPWRGMMLDVSRHFFSVDEIKGMLDILAFHKFNVFHWHLTDDGGWRMESDQFPNLTNRGAWREEKNQLWDYFDLDFPGRESGKPLYGGFYTKEEMREVVRYAAEHHIDVLPEIDVPGHSLAACWSYPELTCDEHARDRFLTESKMHFPNVLCAGKETTYQFLSAILDEVLEIFPFEIVHIGGDEVSKILWKHCAHCQAKMKAEGLADEDELQSYFIKRMGQYLSAKGRRLMGWDEILEGGLAPNAMVMSWRGVQGGIEAAEHGHSVVMSPTSFCYLDYDHATITLDKARSFDPRRGLSKGQGKHVLGGQANLWTEYVPNIVAAQQRMFPRLAGIAEALWSGASDEPFAERLPCYLDLLRDLGVSFYREDTALVGAFQEGVVFLNT